MSRIYVMFVACFFAASGCSDNEANLVQANNGNNGGENNQNSSNNQNNQNNRNNVNNTNNSNNTNANNVNNTNGGNNTNNVNNGTPSIYDVEPESDNRDYSGTLPSRPTGEVAEFAFDMAEAHCGKLFECRTNSFVYTAISNRRFATVGDCVTWFLDRNAAVGFQDAVDEGRAVFDATRASACLDSINTGDCVKAAIAIDGARSQYQTCQDVLTGLRDETDPCLSNADCSIGTFCATTFAEVCAGECQGNDLLGPRCGDTGCELSEYCDVTTMSCEPFRGEDESCTETQRCDIGLFCNAGSCSPIKYGYQAGQPCNQFSNLCTPGTYCDISPVEDAGTCVELESSGGGCSTDRVCVWNAKCGQNGTCEEKVDGGACILSSDCRSGVCSSADSTCFPTEMTCNEGIDQM